MIATSVRFAQEPEQRADLVAEAANTSSGGGFVKSPKADFREAMRVQRQIVREAMRQERQVFSEER